MLGQTRDIETRMKKRWPFLLIAAVLLLWAGYLALGAALNERPIERYAVLKPIIIFGCMALFLGFWWIVFQLSANRRAKAAEKPKKEVL
jgi:protein-S-isoprenylcysteine O-methyltransferase Ste14